LQDRWGLTELLQILALASLAVSPPASALSSSRP
jgi:hypothetical protein